MPLAQFFRSVAKVATGLATRAAVFRALVVSLLLAGAALGSSGPAAAYDPPRVAVVALALWSDPVFRSEAQGAAQILSDRFGHSGPAVVRINTPKDFAAGPRGIATALAAARRGMDPARDVLFVVLTSHGARQGIGERGGGHDDLLSPGELAALLAQSPFREKVLVVSACFAGIFTGLADPDTLVVTAADADHTSFGCEPEARWTYFGDAFFNHALRRHQALPKAFAEARALVGAREAAQGFEPSNPQIAGGENVLARLQSLP